jgi:hypothetical protein
VGATLDAAHQEIRVRKLAAAEAAPEEWEEAAGAPFVHYSAQSEPFLSLKLNNHSPKKCLQ